LQSAHPFGANRKLKMPGIRSTAGVVTTAAVVMVGVFSVFEFGEPSVAPEAPPTAASA
jgi:hypothetical protein